MVLVPNHKKDLAPSDSFDGFERAHAHADFDGVETVAFLIPMQQHAGVVFSKNSCLSAFEQVHMSEGFIFPQNDRVFDEIHLSVFFAFEVLEIATFFQVGFVHFVFEQIFDEID